MGAGLDVIVTSDHMSVRRGIKTTPEMTRTRSTAPHVAPGIIMISGRTPSQLSDFVHLYRAQLTSQSST